MHHNSSSYERYERQILLKEFGRTGQQKLEQARVLVVGAGGLGCAALQYLAAAGIGCIGIIDQDTVALHNLHRQVLYGMEDIGHFKATRAAMALRRLNPAITIEVFNERLTVKNALALLRAYDLIIDGTDNFSTRYLVNDACVLLNKPLVYGAVSRFEGQVAVFNYSGDGQPAANYRDLFPQPPAAGEIANCAEAGVLGVLPGIMGALQASETIKLLTGMGKSLANRLITFNALDNQLYELQLTAQKNTRNLIPSDAAAFEQMDYDGLCGIMPDPLEIGQQEFDALRTKDNLLIIDVREYDELPAVPEFDHIHIPLAGIEDKFPTTEADTIIVFCQSGARSLQAARLLSGKFGTARKIRSLAGGILSWKQQH
ncbi:MAG: HesA/MoeB/ThiF family protein [Bacteroidota bacterium]